MGPGYPVYIACAAARLLARPRLPVSEFQRRLLSVNTQAVKPISFFPISRT